MIHLFKCHVHLENWQYLESLLSMKRGSDAIDLWETCHQNKEVRQVSIRCNRLNNIIINNYPFNIIIY